MPGAKAKTYGLPPSRLHFIVWDERLCSTQFSCVTSFSLFQSDHRSKTPFVVTLKTFQSVGSLALDAITTKRGVKGHLSTI